MFTRPDTMDAYILKEINRTYGWMKVENKVVLDIGACFGGAVDLFLNNGAKQVIAVEPEKDNFRLLRQNTARKKNVICVNAAVTPSNVGSVDLYISPGNTGGHSISITRGRSPVSVPSESFTKLLSKYKPSVLKIDCEGAEYNFLLEPLPGYVKQVTIEIHLGKKLWREQTAPRLVKLFKDWECMKQPKLTGANWHTVGAWRR